MAKLDYRLTAVIDKYKSLVRKQTISRITIADEEVRGVGELLDMNEELFETKKNGITAEKLRAFFHMLIKSMAKPKEIKVHYSDIDWSGLPTSQPRERGLLWNNRGVIQIS